MRRYICDFCGSQVDDAHEAGWFAISQLRQDHTNSGPWGGSSAKADAVGYFCSRACLVKYAEIEAVEFGPDEERSK